MHNPKSLGGWRDPIKGTSGSPRPVSHQTEKTEKKIKEETEMTIDKQGGMMSKWVPARETDGLSWVCGLKEYGCLDCF